jgi:hypothetical protein
VADKIFNPVTGTEMGRKDSFVYFVLIIDFTCVFLFICFINLLEKRTHQYIEAFDNKNVEIRDFTIECNNVPPEFQYGGKDLLLKAQLLNHFERHVKDAMLQKAIREKDEERIKQINEEKQWEIIDVNLLAAVHGSASHDHGGDGHGCSHSELEILVHMDQADRKKKTLLHNLAAAKNADPPQEVDEAKILEEVKKELEAYNKYKKEYINLQNNQLYEEWTLDDHHGRTEDSVTVKTAWITFRSMYGKEKAMQIFEYAEKLGKDDSSQEVKMFWDRYLEVSTPIAAQAYIWGNLKHPHWLRYLVQGIVWGIAVGIIILAFYFMVQFKLYSDSLIAAAPKAMCPEAQLPVSEAYDDFTKPFNQRNNRLHCYCRHWLEENGEVASTFKEFKTVAPQLEVTPCKDWEFAYNFSFYLIIIAGAMISMINVVCVVIFELVANFELCRDYAELSNLQFLRIFIIQYLNICLVLIFADMSVGYTYDEIGYIILVGKYKDFDSAWYFDVGAKITFAMVTNSIAPFGGRLAHPIVSILLRLLNRGLLKGELNKHLRRQTNYLLRKEKEEQEQQKNQPAIEDEKPAKS